MEEQNERVLNHAWRYFELHANQRMSVFNFFLVLSALVAAGLAASFQGTGLLPPIGAVLGSTLALVSFTFWKLDQRVSFLIKHAEQALARSESALPEPSARLFSNEPPLSEDAQSTGPFWKRQWTYGRSFRLVFCTMGIFGFLGAILSLCRSFGWMK